MAEPRRRYYVCQWGEYPDLKSGSNTQKVFRALRKAGDQGASQAQIAVDAGLSKPQTRKALAGLLVHPKSCVAVLHLDDVPANIDFAVERIRLQLHFGDLHASESTLKWMAQRIGEVDGAEEAEQRIVEALVLDLRRRPFRALSAYHSEEENRQIAGLASEWINDLLDRYGFDFEVRLHEKRDFELEVFLGPDIIDLSTYRRFRSRLVVEDVAAQ